MLNHARELRRDMTPQERKLWYLFLRTYPVKIYKQRIVESFIVDFYCCASARLAIEVDGSQHYEEQGPPMTRSEAGYWRSMVLR